MHGIGGNTIREAKSKLTRSEFLEWAHFISLRGTLHWGRRIDKSGALVASMAGKVFNGKMADLMPFEKTDSGEVDLLEQYLMEFGEDG